MDAPRIPGRTSPAPRDNERAGPDVPDERGDTATRAGGAARSRGDGTADRSAEGTVTRVVTITRTAERNMSHRLRALHVEHRTARYAPFETVFTQGDGCAGILFV